MHPDLSFKETMRRKRRTFGPDDIKKALNPDDLKFKGGRKVNNGIPTFGRKATDDKSTFYFGNDMDLYAALVNENEGLYTDDLIEATTGAPSFLYAESRPKIPPEMEFKTPRPPLPAFLGMNEGDIKSDGYKVDEILNPAKRQFVKLFGTDPDVYPQQFNEFGKWILDIYGWVDAKRKQEIPVMDRYRGRGTFQGVYRTKRNENGDLVIDTEPGIKYHRENTDPEVAEAVREFETESDPDTDERTIYDNLSAKGYYGDKTSDKYRVIKAIWNMAPETRRCIANVSRLLKGCIFGSLLYYFDSNFTPGSSKPGRFRKPRIQFDLGNMALNNSGANNSGTRFHEIFHAVTSLRKAYSDGTATNKETGVTRYNMDDDAYHAALTSATSSLISSPEQYKAYMYNLFNEKIMTGSIFQTKVLIDGCRLLSIMRDDSTVKSLKSEFKFRFGQDGPAGHGIEYFMRYNNPADRIGLIVNEMLSAMIKIEINGDMGNQKLGFVLGPFMKAYYNTVSQFLDITPDRFTPVDATILPYFAFGDEPNATARSYLQGIKRSASFKDTMDAVQRRRYDPRYVTGKRTPESHPNGVRRDGK